jgi:hypothetical protein
MTAYADPRKVVTIRLFEEVDGTWSVDGLDGEGRYTESCWNFDTREQALFAVDEFQNAVGTSTDRVFAWSEELQAGPDTEKTPTIREHDSQPLTT